MEAVIGLGSNLGSREVILRAAVDLLRHAPGIHVVAESPLYETPSSGGPPGAPAYLNGAVRLSTPLDLDALHVTTLAVEHTLGRERSRETERNAPRTCDLDILWAWGAAPAEHLVVPHPRLRDRAFALGPLLDVAPELGDELGPLLVTLGGPPRRHPPARIEVDRTRRTVRATAATEADALAAAATALPALLENVAVPGFDRLVDLEIAVDPEDAPAVLADAVMTAKIGGMEVSHVVLLDHDGARLTARLVGTDDGDPPEKTPPLRVATLTRSQEGPTVTLGLGSNQPGNA